MNIDTAYLHMGWGMSYPFSPRTWSQKEWEDWIFILAQGQFKRLMLWPGFEFINTQNPDEIMMMRTRCSNIIQACHRHGLKVWLGRSINAVLTKSNVPFERRDVRHCRTIDVGSDAYQQDVLLPLGEMLKDVPAFEGWWCIDRDPGRSYGRHSYAFARAIKQMMFHCPGNPRPIYWMWGGWTEDLDGAPDWREQAQIFWREAHQSCVDIFEQELITLCCWPGHFKSLVHQEHVYHFPYHGLEPEPSIPFTSYPEETQHHLELQGSCTSSILNLQTPCLRTFNALETKRQQTWITAEPSEEELKANWVWSASSLETMLPLWRATRETLRTKHPDVNLIQQWTKHCGVDFPHKRGRLHEALLS